MLLRSVACDLSLLMQAPDFHHIAAFVTSFDVTGEDIADCNGSDEFASYIPGAPQRYAKRCYRYLDVFLRESATGGSAAAGWFCAVRSRFVAHESKPACTRKMRLFGVKMVAITSSYVPLMHDAGACVLYSRGDASLVVGIVAAVATAPLSATVKNNSTDALAVRII